MNGLNRDVIMKWLRIIGIIIAAITGTQAVNSVGCRMNPRNESNPPATTPAPHCPAPGQDRPPAPAPQPLAAIGRIQVGAYGCSATLIGPRHPDGTYDLASAAHCIPDSVRVGMMRLESGKTVGIRVTAIDRNSDCAWFRTIGDVGELPFAMLAEALPKIGEKVWHAGYGEHNPRSREDGTVTDPITTKGQTEFWLSVSSGDSGGGIVCNESGRILATVCCTTQRNRPARVWGCSVEALVKLRPKENVSDFVFRPIDIPVVE